jgi:hypothetical protein
MVIKLPPAGLLVFAFCPLSRKQKRKSPSATAVKIKTLAVAASKREWENGKFSIIAIQAN